MSRRRRHSRRRVAIVTGTRAEYGLLRSTLDAISDHDQLDLQLVVTGVHLLRRFGMTVRDVEADGYRIDARVRMQRGNDNPLDQSNGLARGVAGIAEFLINAETDIVLVLGDRIEALAGALAATTTGKLLAHVHGGDVAPGDADNLQRDAITKLAQIHLAATRKSADRIVRMGESRQHVHVVGAPGLDDLFSIRRLQRSNKTQTVLVLHHPCGRDARTEQRVMSNVLRSIRSETDDMIVIHPNSDRGHSGILAAIDDEQASQDRHSHLRVLKSMPRQSYLEALAGSRLIIGNSSSGIIEAPALGVPSVNVGDRQSGRERGGPTVIDASEGYRSIHDAVRQATTMTRRRRPITPYGRGRAGERIANILADTHLTDDLRRKVR